MRAFKRCLTALARTDNEQEYISIEAARISEESGNGISRLLWRLSESVHRCRYRSEGWLFANRPDLTPFHVEFARASTKRAGAPTLVPVERGGLPVNGCIFVLNVSEEDGANRLWRREISAVGSGRTYKRPAVVGENSVLVERLTDFEGLDVVLYTRIAANIAPLSAQKLAELAISSAGKIKDGRDGISYLIAAKRNGIKTLLSRTTMNGKY